jgi:cell division protein ZapA (FtsZ GTPase activity inhibitor)
MMTALEIKHEVRKMQEFTAEIEKSPGKAREFLSKLSMYTKNGNLKKQFR